MMWCPDCGRLVPVGRFRREWNLKYLGGCTKEEAGPDMWRNYIDCRLVHDVYTYRVTGAWPDDGRPEDIGGPAGPEPAAAGAYQDLLVDTGEQALFGEGETSG
jgi:hypothetical protein